MGAPGFGFGSAVTGLGNAAAVVVAALTVSSSSSLAYGSTLSSLPLVETCSALADVATATTGLGDDDAVAAGAVVSICTALLEEVAGMGKVTPVLCGGVIAGWSGDADVAADVDGPRPSSTGSSPHSDAVSSGVGVSTAAATGFETRGTGRPTPLGRGRPFCGDPAASSSDVFGGMMTVLGQGPPHLLTLIEGSPERETHTPFCTTLVNQRPRLRAQQHPDRLFQSPF